MNKAAGFPIQSGWSKARHEAIPATRIPWAMIEPHEEQALRNHAGQDLEKLASRGGLGACEALAVLEDRVWSLMNEDVAAETLAAKVAAWRP